MRDLFKRTTISIIISSVVAFIIGLMMAVVPNMSLQVISTAIGIYIILHGIALIVLDFMAHNIYIPFYGILSGLLSVVAGLILIAIPNMLSTIFAIALGIWIILSSANIISIAITVRKSIMNWYLWFILGIIDFVCGVIILFNPFASSLSIVVLGGIIIMIHSVVSVVGMIMIRKDARGIAKAFEASFKELK